MKYWDITGGVDLFWDMVESGYIRVQTHPEFPELRIANYAEKTVFDREWNDATRASRGLIFNIDTGDVLARPFPKFFNYGEADSPVLLLDMEVWVSDKMDGSLGIIYVAPDGSVRVATRGSFASDQALHATRVLNQKYPEWVRAWKRSLSGIVTPLVEIIYPENRIVCDYGETDDLVLLGWIGVNEGNYVPANMGDWDGPRAQSFDFDNFSQVLAAAPRPGAEGFVVYVPEIHDWVKIKQSDYIELHRIVTGLSARRVYEALRSGQTVEEICAPLPDEFHGFVREVTSILGDRVRERYRVAVSQYDYIVEALHQRGIDFDHPGFRKEFALMAKVSAFPSLLFSLLDGKDIRDSIWKMFQPDADWVPGNHDRFKD
jgi:RNA ligase